MRIWPFTRTAPRAELRAVDFTDFHGRPRLDVAGHITRDGALSLSGVYAAIRLLSETISTLPLQAVQTDGADRLPVDLPVLEALKWPNDAMSGQTFLEVMIAHLETHGEAYAEIVRAGGEVIGFWPLDPARVRPERIGAGLRFHVQTASGVREVGPNQILFLKNAVTGTDGIRGVSPLRLLAPDLAAAKLARDYAARYFENGAAPAGVLRHPAELSPEAAERLRTQFDARYSGKDAHKTMLLEQGMEWQSTGLDPEKSQLLESRQFAIADISRIWRVPPHLLADLSRSTFTNSETEMRSLVTHSLRPRLARLEAQLAHQLLTPAERRRVAFRFNLDSLLRGNTLDRYRAHQIGVTAGFISRNEARRLEDLPQVPGLDEYLITPGATVAAGEQPNEGATATDAEENAPNE